MHQYIQDICFCIYLTEYILNAFRVGNIGIINLNFLALLRRVFLYFPRALFTGIIDQMPDIAVFSEMTQDFSPYST